MSSSFHVVLIVALLCFVFIPTQNTSAAPATVASSLGSESTSSNGCLWFNYEANFNFWPFFQGSCESFYEDSSSGYCGCKTHMSVPIMLPRYQPGKRDYKLTYFSAIFGTSHQVDFTCDTPKAGQNAYCHSNDGTRVSFSIMAMTN
eukprot:Nk52_evm44s240 gene=Nk52_evmTU44s240